jgi:F-type H+-transporting ATPase subunit delta
MRASKSYARAFVAYAQERGLKDADLLKAQEGMLSLAEAIAGHSWLRAALMSPVTTLEQKLALSEELCARVGLDALAQNFLSLLIRNGRLEHLGEVVDSIEWVRLEAQGAVRGKLQSAQKLSPEDVQEIAKAFTSKLGKRVELGLTVDPDLIAGLKVEVQGVTYDGSLRGQLKRVRQSLIQEATPFFN